jgi:hypothetical protein
LTEGSSQKKTGVWNWTGKKKVFFEERKKARKKALECVLEEMRQDLLYVSTQGRQRLQGFLPQLDESYFTTPEKKILENCRYIVPNFMND